MRDSHRVGRDAESAAADYLLKLGYTIITRRYRAAHGEIDLVCLDQDTHVFVEVRARSSRKYLPEETIDAAKLSHLQSAGGAYCRAMKEERQVRYDVIALDGTGVRHHKNLFGHF